MKKRIGDFKKGCSRRPHEYWVCEAKKAQERLISCEIEKERIIYVFNSKRSKRNFGWNA